MIVLMLINTHLSVRSAWMDSTVKESEGWIEKEGKRRRESEGEKEGRSEGGKERRREGE